MQMLKAEVERLVKIGVLKKLNRSEWAAPTSKKRIIGKTHETVVIEPKQIAISP